MMEIVGEYIQLFNDVTGQNLPCGYIYQSAGLRVHVEKHHPTEVDVLRDVALIIAEPDYIGHHPKEPDSVELVKCLTRNEMVCVKLDKKEGYLYVASVYTISNAKVENRIKSGRLKFLDI